MAVTGIPRKLENDAEKIDRHEIPKDVRVIAKEVEIVRSLACNDLNKRNRQLKRLGKWLTLRTRSSFPFTEEDLQRIWKGLYYAMWMSDKPLVQEDTAEQLAQLLLRFDGNLKASAEFFGAFLFTMYHQWFGIDQWRIDKFMMLVRRMLRYMFRVLKDSGWSSEGINLFNKQVVANVFADRVGGTGLTLHILDIYCEELAKVGGGNIDAAQVGQLIRPFVEFYCTQRDCKLTSHCRTRIFYHLLYQSSLGREYMEKYNAWKTMGFPTASLNDLEKIEDESAEENEMPHEDETDKKEQHHLDPRAGKVDVYMPELPVDVTHIIEELKVFLKKRESSTKRRKQFRKLIETLKTFQNGEFPLGIKKMPRVNLQPKEEVIAEKLENLDDIENDLFGVGRKLKKLNKRKRRKLLKALNWQDVTEENYDNVVENAIPHNPLKARKRKGNDKLMNSWIEEDVDEDLTPKKKKIKKSSLPIQNTTEDVKAANINDSKEKQRKGEDKSMKNKNLPENEKQSMENKLTSTEKEDAANTEIHEDPTAPKSLPREKQEIGKPQNIEPAAQNTLPQETKDQNASYQWETPLEDGEVEYFISSRKFKIKKANTELVLNPLAVNKKLNQPISPKTPKKIRASFKHSLKTSASAKRVKIALKHNTEQRPSEYIRQVKSSPNVPYDASKKPGKGLLKPHSVPSPINPFYQKKIGLRLLKETL